MTKIFISSKWFSPAFRGGGPIQSLVNLIEKVNKDIQYFVFTSAVDEDGTVLDVETDQWIQYNEYCSVFYASKDISNTLTKQIEELKPDLLFINGLFDWHFNIVPAIYGNCKNKILSIRGMLRPQALASKRIKKKLFLNTISKLSVWKKIKFHVTIPEEIEDVHKQFGTESEVFLIPNLSTKILAQTFSEKEVGKLKMLTTALVSEMKNYELVLEALNQISGEVYYDIYGAIKDYEYWQKCLSIIKKLPSNIRVEYKGEMPPKELHQQLSNYHLMIMPSKSENYGHAIVESLQAGLPVLTSNNVPWINLKENFAGENIDTNSTSIANAIQFFVDMDDDEWKKYNIGSINYIQKQIDEEKIIDSYFNMFAAQK